MSRMQPSHFETDSIKVIAAVSTIATAHWTGTMTMQPRGCGASSASWAQDVSSVERTGRPGY